LNLKYLGDALDHWKGSLFESLQREKLVDDFAVDPMASDLSSWRDEDFQLLARLLRVHRHQVIHHETSLSDRQRYFDEIKHMRDIFLDPDTGVATGHVTRHEHYVLPNELARLLDHDGRMVLVYQHVRATKVRARVDAVLLALATATGNVGWCSYESGTVALLCLSKAAERTSLVAAHFGTMLGRHAEGRVRGGIVGPSGLTNRCVGPALSAAERWRETD
jgi:hypothetical protein